MDDTTATRTIITQWIDMVAQEIVKELERNNTLDVSDILHESVDGSQWVIYYGKAQEVVNVYAGDDEVDDAYENAKTWEPGSYWKLQSLMAYDILYNRVAAALRSRGVEC